ncbi:hypothetical protein GCM10009689_37900 [Brevibacterium antiquum]|uniref:hypothetical protein n=1 Tax=Brevibacterium antiquum TaxID=234835 RepID=UPI001E4A13FA|nr:hypothetical protein [Brevibacterium antiquum]
MTEPMHEPQQNDEPQQAEASSQPASPSRPTPAPTPSAPTPAPTPSAPTPAPTPPNPASVNGDVPVENWRRDLEQIDQAPSAERHALLSALLDELDSQVSSL